MRSRSVFIGTGILLLAACTAQAEPEIQHTAYENPRGPGSLSSLSSASGERGWVRTHLDRIHLHKKAGLAYTKSFDAVDRDLLLSVRGPALGRKRYGLALELRF